MAPTNHQSEHKQPPETSAAPVQSIRVLCPHCAKPIDILPLPMAHQTGTNTTSAMVSEQPIGMFTKALRRLVEGNSAQRDSQQQSGQLLALQRWQKWIISATMILVLLLVTVILLRQSPTLSVQPAPNTNATVSVAATPRSQPASTTALIETLTQYNAAETEAAALLSITAIQPFLAPEGSLLARRTAELAERKRRNAPHRSILVRWAIGDVTITGKQATVITQETWSNQEIGAVHSQQATVRVTYTLRWNDSQQRWLILTTNQMPIG